MAQKNSWLANLFKPKEEKQSRGFTDAITMIGYEPKFTSFGKQALYSSLVLSAIQVQQRFFGKLEPRHIRYENGKSDYRKKSDIGLCSEIDRAVWERYGKTSVYQLSTEEKEGLMKHYQSRYHIGEKQLRRCLAMEYREY